MKVGRSVINVNQPESCYQNMSNKKKAEAGTVVWQSRDQRWQCVAMITGHTLPLSSTHQVLHFNCKIRFMALSD